jgi:plastocyanin
MQENEGFLSRRDVIRGAVGAGAAGTVAAEPAVAQEGTTHTVDMTDQLVFEPDELTVAPGDTVVWENVGTVGHSVTAYEEEIPEDAEFFASGGLESEQAARDSYPSEGDVPGGESSQHSFEVEGEYGYFCIPHEAVGMVGTLTVTTEQQGVEVVRPHRQSRRVRLRWESPRRQRFSRPCHSRTYFSSTAATTPRQDRNDRFDDHPSRNERRTDLVSAVPVEAPVRSVAVAP